MFAIEYSTDAQRELRALPSETRQLITRLVHGAAELAEIYPETQDVWRRLGRVTSGGIEVEVESQRVLLAIDAGRSQLRVVKISEERRLVRPKRRRSLTPPELRVPRAAKLRVH